MVEKLEDGRAKIYLIHRILAFRRENPRLFEAGDYLPLMVEGDRSEHLCSFARVDDDSALIAVAPRWFAELCGEENRLPVGELVWGDTRLLLPDMLEGRQWHTLLGNKAISIQCQNGQQSIPVAALLTNFPAGVLVSVYA